MTLDGGRGHSLLFFLNHKITFVSDSQNNTTEIINITFSRGVTYISISLGFAVFRQKKSVYIGMNVKKIPLENIHTPSPSRPNISNYFFVAFY